MLRQGFLDEDVLILQLDGKPEYIVFINEAKYKKEFHSIEYLNKFLEMKYMPSSSLAAPHLSAKNHLAISDQTDKYSIRYGRCTVYTVIFFRYGTKKIYFKKSNKMYYYHDDVYGTQQTYSLENAINQISRSISPRDH